MEASRAGGRAIHGLGKQGGVRQSGLLSSLFGVKNFDFSLLQTDMFVGKGGGFEVWHPGFWFWFRDLGAC